MRILRILFVQTLILSSVEAAATVSAGCVSAGVVDCCDTPHPTSTTVAIVVISTCFISWGFSNGGKSWASLENCLAEIQLVNNPQIVAYGIKSITTVTPE